MKLCTKYQRPGLLVSDKIFEGFLFKILCKTVDPGAGPFLAPEQ